MFFFFFVVLLGVGGGGGGNSAIKWLIYCRQSIIFCDQINHEVNGYVNFRFVMQRLLAVGCFTEEVRQISATPGNLTEECCLRTANQIPCYGYQVTPRVI